jgi:ferredoxin
MSESRLRRMAVWAMASFVAILIVDYAVATYRAPIDDARVAAMQKQNQNDAAVAPKFLAEQKRITDAHLARRTRDRVVTWMLMLVAAAFIVSSGTLVGRRDLPARPARDPKKARPRVLKPPSPLLKGPNRAQLRYRITEGCIGCTVCAQVCPKGAITFRPYEKHVVNDALCTPCDMCRRVCEEDAVEIVERSAG